MSEPIQVQTTSGKVIEVRDFIPYRDGTIDVKGWDKDGNFRHWIHRDIVWTSEVLAQIKGGM